MEKNKYIFVLILFFSALYSVNAQTNEINFHSCDFLVTIAPPQLLIKKTLSQSDLTLIHLLAKRDAIILDDGTVCNHEKLAEIALTVLGRNDIALSFGFMPNERAVLVGWIHEVVDDNEHHFILIGIDKQIMYNPCDAKGTIQSIQEIYVFAH